MYKEHKYIETPKSGTVIWRYLDMTKLLSILERQELYFSRVDKYKDPFEGAITKPALEEMKSRYGWGENGMFKKVKERMFLNCWHISEYESEAMWNLYSHLHLGIAIRTTVESLIKSINKEERFHVFIGKINYLDYEKDKFDYGNIFCYFLNKRKSFEHEKEVRAIVDLGIENPISKANELHYDEGLYIKVNVNQLIESIYLAPYSPDWFVELVDSIKIRYGYNFDVRKSMLSTKPLFL